MVDQLQGIHDRLVFIFLVSLLFCLSLAFESLLELEELAGSQPCMNVFFGHSYPALSLLKNQGQ